MAGSFCRHQQRIQYHPNVLLRHYAKPLKHFSFMVYNNRIAKENISADMINKPEFRELQWVFMNSTICYVTAAVKRAINDNSGMLGNPFSTVNLSDCCQSEYTPPPPPPRQSTLYVKKKKNGEKDTKLTSLLIVVIMISKDQKIQTRSNRKI